MHAGFEIEIVNRDGNVHLEIVGELDVASAGLLDAALLRAEATAAGLVVIDLTKVTFIDSTGLRAVLRAHARSEQKENRLRIIGGSEPIQRLFALAGVLERLPFIAAGEG